MRSSDWSADVCSSDLLVPIVQEYVLNTYIKYDQYDVQAADDYWAATKEYWAAVRAEWDRVAATKGGIAIEEKADTGTVISGRMLAMADEEIGRASCRERVCTYV